MSVHQGSVPKYDDGTATSTSAAYAEHGFGWVVFAGTMLLMVGSLNVIYGIGAISNSSFFVNNARYVFSDLNTWGWIVLVCGCAQVLTALGVWAGSVFATWLGVAFAGLNAMIQLLMIPAYPFLALALFAIDLLVIYGLAVHGGHEEA
ncbi:MAG: hypothetical protein JWQ48_1390 [Conexibacter sp.]|jgi:hypothetical protein|nr:hypothetical protein [Conexibacter sp.]